MTGVECSSKSGPYCCHVCDGALASEPLTATNTSLGLRTTCTIQFTAAQATTSTTVTATIRTPNGAARIDRRVALAIVAWDMTNTHPLWYVQRDLIMSKLKAHDLTPVA